MVKVSVIVAVYNTGGGGILSECVNSLISQTFRDFEIILVNDGSTDDSGDICDSFANEYPALVKVIHKEKVGCSVARNIGIAAASGEWIMIVDNDDWVEPDILEIMVREAQSANCDICICGFKKEYPNQSIRSEFNQLSGYQLTNKDKLILLKQHLETRWVGNFQEDVGIGYPWAKLYRKKLLVDNKIVFIEDIFLAGEDVMFNMYAIELSAKTIFIKDVLYHYRQHSNQFTRNYLANMPDLAENFLREAHIFVNRFYTEEDADLIYNNLVLDKLILLIRRTYRPQNAPFSLRQRIRGIKDAINKQPYKKALCYIHYQDFSRKKKTQLWLLRKMPVSFYYFVMRVFDWSQGRG